MTEVSLVLPAYNEAERLRDTVRQVADALQKMTTSFEIIIAEDGSTDGTSNTADELAREFTYVTHLHSNERLGRGKALNRAFKSSKGEIVAYIDVDLATDLKHLDELIESIREGYDIATGSRMLKESDVVFTTDPYQVAYDLGKRDALREFIPELEDKIKQIANE